MSGRGLVLVTGAGRGIGRATALALASAGYDLVLWSRSVESLESVAEQAKAHGVRVAHAAVDVGDAAAVEVAGREMLPGDERLVGVVLNAGHGTWTHLDHLSAPEWESTIDANLSGAFHVLQACRARLALNSYALVIGVLSDSALYPFTGRAAYSAAKAGMRSLLEVARLELRQQATRVSLVFPSRVDTFFKGSHAHAQPGTRPGSLSADDVAQVICTLFALPAAVEIREIHLTSMASSFGPFNETVEHP